MTSWVEQNAPPAPGPPFYILLTCTLRGVRNRAPDEFGLFREVPGDFHTQGYVMQECLSRICGPGGFYYTIRQLLGRLKLTPKSFVDVFKEGNYERNKDALNDYFWGLCIAAVLSFVSSDFFPDKVILCQAQARCGNAKTREACWLSSLNLFCALNKKNYKDEAIAHITSFTALWPSAIREMFRKNLSIS